MMIQRITTGWNFTRVVYVLLGVALVVQSLPGTEWFGIVFGSYFAAMGVFAFGCAGGNCLGGRCDYRNEKDVKTDV